MIDVLEHIDPSESVPLMRAVHSALRPAGRLVARVPNAASPFGGFWRYQDYTHKTAFTHISLSYLLRNAGFSKISVVGEGSVIRRPPPLTRPRRFIKWLIYAGMIACYRIAFMESMGNKEPLINTPFSLNVIAVGQKHAA
jgi:SAM-dependent methyltransferase